MGFDYSFAFRDCHWCGLQGTQLQANNQGLVTSSLTGLSRFWALCHCPRCAGPVLTEISDPNSPPKLIATIPDSPSGEVEHLPPDVAEFYDGARRVLTAGVPDAAAVQLRKTLEAAAAYFGFEKDVLVKRIQKLIGAGLITKPFGDVLDHIRKMGNVGAHASDERVDEATVRRAYKFTTQVLRNGF